MQQRLDGPWPVIRGPSEYVISLSVINHLFFVTSQKLALSLGKVTSLTCQNTVHLIIPHSRRLHNILLLLHHVYPRQGPAHHLPARQRGTSCSQPPIFFPVCTSSYVTEAPTLLGPHYTTTIAALPYLLSPNTDLTPPALQISRSQQI